MQSETVHVHHNQKLTLPYIMYFPASWVTNIAYSDDYKLQLTDVIRA